MSLCSERLWLRVRFFAGYLNPNMDQLHFFNKQKQSKITRIKFLPRVDYSVPLMFLFCFYKFTLHALQYLNYRNYISSISLPLSHWSDFSALRILNIFQDLYQRSYEQFTIVKVFFCFEECPPVFFTQSPIFLFLPFYFRLIAWHDLVGLQAS